MSPNRQFIFDIRYSLFYIQYFPHSPWEKLNFAAGTKPLV